MKATRDDVRRLGLELPRPNFDATVPVPPSVNNLFATVGRRRIPTREYKAWLAAALPAMERMRVQTEFPCRIVVSVFGKVNAARDVDNLAKPIGDALVAAGVLPGDSIRAGVWECTQRYFPEPTMSGPVALVQVERVIR